MSIKTGGDDQFGMSEQSKLIEKKFLDMSAGVMESMGFIPDPANESDIQQNTVPMDGSDNTESHPPHTGLD